MGEHCVYVARGIVAKGESLCSHYDRWGGGRILHQARRSSQCWIGPLPRAGGASTGLITYFSKEVHTPYLVLLKVES